MANNSGGTVAFTGGDFDLDVQIVESGEVVAALLRSTDDNCGSTCGGSACASGGGNV
ncbi:FxLD family lanthipeptide (plasmid) [Kitasatospora sp. NBC_00070]|uniref:FxLD family lanthipeptide n=1 Tax=Kitasatospora sp. NBC_00070 TaxID=2975962 RepID=UPI002F918EC5